MKEQFKIDRGVPLPVRVKTGIRSKYRLDELGVGDSILIPKELRNSVTSSWIRFAPKRFTSAIDKNDRTQVRVWRVK